MQGFSPIITTASPKHTAFLQSLGATHVLDRSLSPAELATAVSSATGGAPVDVVYDSISSPDTQAVGYAALAPGGTLLTTGPPAVPAALPPTRESTPWAYAHPFRHYRPCYVNSTSSYQPFPEPLGY